MSPDTKDLICAMCEKPLSLHEDGLEVVEKAKISRVQKRRCYRCQGRYNKRPKKEWVVNPGTRYEDDPAAQIFVAMYPDGAPGKIVGGVLGLTHQRISQIEYVALRRLQRHPLVNGDLRDLFYLLMESRGRESDYPAWE